MVEPKIEKRCGWDWTVFYRWDDEPGIHVMSVFGAMSIALALEDAKSSIGDDAEIIGCLRQDVKTQDTLQPAE